MRVWTLPAVVLAVATTFPLVDNQPSERAMRDAFEASLAAQVRNALDFLAESGGPEAVAKAREAGTDQFRIQAFRKLYCRTDDKAGHVCAFAIRIDVRDGSLQQIRLGRFLPQDDALAFVYES
jgi:hypothetical protein